MVNEVYKSKAHSLVQRAKEKGLIKSYKDFCNTKIAEETKLAEDEVAYYISEKKEDKKWKNMLLEI